MSPLLDFPKTIKTPRLVLRVIAATRENAERLFDIIEQNRDYLEAWQGHFEYIHNADDVLDFLGRRAKQIEDNTGMCFYIYRGGEIIGRIRFSVTASSECEIGYWLVESATGNGYMAESLGALESELFKFGFEKIIIDVDAGNMPSENVARRAGYVLEKRLPMTSWAKCVGKCDSLIFVKSDSNRKTKPDNQNEK